MQAHGPRVFDAVGRWNVDALFFPCRNGETLKQLSQRFKVQKEQKDKYKKRTDKLVADLEQTARTKEMEAERLGHMLEEERMKHQRAEADMLESQRKTLHEHNLGRWIWILFLLRSCSRGGWGETRGRWEG